MARSRCWNGSNQRGEKFDHAIVGEPTNVHELGDTIKIGRRGSLNGRLTVRGRQGHVAYPHRANNPVPHALALAAALIATPLDSGTDWFDASNLEITSIDIGNAATNVIPGEALVRFNVRFNDAWTPESLAVEIRRRLESARPAERFELAFDPCNAVSFVTKPGPFTELAARAIEAETGRRPDLRPREAPRTRNSLPNTGLWWNSAWSARPCTRSTSASRPPISMG